MISVEIVSKPGKLREAVDQVERVVGMLRNAVGTATEPAREQPVHDRAEAQESAGSQEPSVPTANRNGSPGMVARRSRWQDEAPLPADLVALVALARSVGADWLQRTGRHATRDQLRAGIRAAGGPGISNVTAGRLLDAIRNDTSPTDPVDTDQGEDGLPADELVGSIHSHD
jgi:hypothetical protein